MLKPVAATKIKTN